MTPIEQAAAVYSREWCARPFAEDLAAHLAGGYVYATPDFFAMGRPVPRGAPAEFIVNPWHTWEREQCDAWLVYLVAGDMSKAWLTFPFSLPWVIFERDNVIKTHRFESLRSKIIRTAPQKQRV